MKNKTLLIIIIIFAVLMLSGTLFTKFGILNTSTSFEEEEKKIEEIATVDELENDKLYVWKNSKDRDISAQNNRFEQCAVGTTNLDSIESSQGDLKYTVWMDSSEDYMIPTLTSEDKLLFVTKSSVPSAYDFLRLYDNGYTIGITSIKKTENGHYYINSTNDHKEYKQYINCESDADSLKELNYSKLIFDKIGKVKVSDKNVSENGVITGLKKDKVYKCEFYTGTYYQDYNLTANQHTFTEYEKFKSAEDEYLHSNCVEIKIPEWLCTGYYYINEVGMFRYVDDNDIANYNGEPYDANIDWNKPLIIKNEDGEIIFDPSIQSEPDIEAEGEIENSATTAETPQEASTVNTSEWTYELTEDEKFTASISVSKLGNTTPATVTVTAPDGKTTDFKELNGKIVVEIFEPQTGAYTFKIDNLGGREFVVVYPNGDTYFGPEHIDDSVGDPGLDEESESDESVDDTSTEETQEQE